jgi:hypothetical protein
MFFAGVSYHFVAISMVMCLFLGGFAYRLSTEKLLIFFTAEQKNISITHKTGENYTYSGEKIAIDKEIFEDKEENKSTFFLSPPQKEKILFKQSYYKECTLINIPLRAPPFVG